MAAPILLAHSQFDPEILEQRGIRATLQQVVT